MMRSSCVMGHATCDQRRRLWGAAAVAVATLILSACGAMQTKQKWLDAWMETMSRIQIKQGEVMEVAMPNDAAEDVDAALIVQPYLSQELIAHATNLPEPVCRLIAEDIAKIEQPHIYMFREGQIVYHKTFPDVFGVGTPGYFYGPVTPRTKVLATRVNDRIRPLRITGIIETGE